MICVSLNMIDDFAKIVEDAGNSVYQCGKNVSSQYESSKDHLGTVITETKNHLNQANSDLEHANSVLENNQTRLELANRKKEETVKKIEDIKRKIENLEREVSSCQTQLRGLSQPSPGPNDSPESYQANMDAYQSKVNAIESRISSLQSEIASLRNELQQLQEYLSRLNEYISRVTGLNQNLSSIIGDIRAKIGALHEYLSELNAQSETLYNQYSTFNFSLTTANARVNHLASLTEDAKQYCGEAMTALERACDASLNSSSPIKVDYPSTFYTLSSQLFRYAHDIGDDVAVLDRENHKYSKRVRDNVSKIASQRAVVLTKEMDDLRSDIFNKAMELKAVGKALEQYCNIRC